MTDATSWLPEPDDSNRPFFEGAWRSIRAGSPGMDVPVAIAMGLAFLASCYNFFRGAGEVWFDSVVMFIFFLLVSRYFELMARKRGAETAESLGQALPVMATRLSTGGSQSQIPVADLNVGDRVLVKPGETIPADGSIETGQSTINILDTGTSEEGIDDLFIYGTLQDDFFLLRAQRNPIWGRVMASVSAIQVDADRKPVPNGFVERVNYDGAIEGRFVIYGREGDDTFVLDDNMAPTVIFGDAGNDTFQIGQVYASPRDGINPDNGLAPEDYFETTQITRGYLSNGASVSTTMFGGTGSDSLSIRFFSFQWTRVSTSISVPAFGSL